MSTPYFSQISNTRLIIQNPEKNNKTKIEQIFAFLTDNPTKKDGEGRKVRHSPGFFPIPD